MDELLHQLGGLLLGSVPTILLFFLVVTCYRVLVYGPLTRVLAERRARTEGAMEQARSAIAAADAKTQEYEAKVRAARVEIFHAREQRLAKWNAERETMLAGARSSAQHRVAEAKSQIEREAAAAHRAIEESAGDLASEVLRAVLPADLVTAGSSR
ncbi:MAG TPA: ATP synthase F0 subunit B [Acidobacteriaceae bacterium]|nr:ATP synthase F0 subunit B [Acidobacteriaceae bacterium]